MRIQTKDTIVIGGGLLGWSVAYRLVKAGQEVAVVDRADDGHATQAGAGIIAPGMSVRTPDAVYPLAREAIRYYPELLGELAHDGESDTDYETVGALFVARTEAEAATLPGLIDEMAARRDDGIGNIGALSLLDSKEARAHFPPLGDIAGAIHAAGAARVNGRHLREALRNASQRLGCQAITGFAQLDPVSVDAVEVQVEGMTLRASSIVVAAGAWSNALGEALGITIPVYPQRGQIVHLDLPDAYTGDWPIVVGYSSHYLLTFRPNRVVAGATREHDSGYDVRTTAGGVDEVLDEALAVAPGLANATVAEIRIGLRPFSPDELPVLGRAPGYPNVYFCTGHGPSGLMLGPYSGAAIASTILGEILTVDLSPFSPDRFRVAEPSPV